MFRDFVVKYDPEKDTQSDLAKRILYSLYIRRIKANFPCVTFISGGSGSGKSTSGALKLMQVLLEMQGIDIRDYLDAVNVYIPLEYPEKLDALLYDKDLKKINVIAIHEAREAMKAKNWNSFINQSIADINAMSRSIKRLMTFIVSQFIRDIDASMRYTLDFYIKVHRGKDRKDKNAKLEINIIWKDDRDLDKPKLRKRRIQGYLVLPDGTYRRFMPKFLSVNLPDKDILEKFDSADTEAKSKITKNKINRLIDEMKSEIPDDDKIIKMVDYYTKDIDTIASIGKRNKKGFKVKPEIRDMHNLSREETKNFEEKLLLKIKEKDLIE